MILTPLSPLESSNDLRLTATAAIALVEYIADGYVLSEFCGSFYSMHGAGDKKDVCGAEGPNKAPRTRLQLTWIETA